MAIRLEDLVAKPKCVSGVWGYFGFIPNDQGQPQNINEAICKLCFRSTGHLPKPVAVHGGNTSNLFSHLRVRHAAVHAEVKAAMATKEASKSTCKSSHQQVTLADTLNKGQAYPRGSRKWKELTDSVTRCIAKDMMPLCTVEKEGFRNLVHTLDPRYDLPSRKYLTTKALPDLYSKTREAVMAEVSNAQFFSGTTDMWSSSSMDPYISFTVHFISDDWKLSNYCLETLFLPQDHTGENIAEVLESILESWNLKVDQLVCLTTDNGTNMVSAASLLGWTRLSCFGHNLNLAVTNATKDDTRISRAVGVCKKIVTSFSHSWKKKQELTKAQVEKGLPEHSLVTDCPTRWGSQQKMVARILEQDAAIRQVLSEDRKTSHLIPTWQDTMVLESISSALTPLHDFTDMLSGEEYVSVSLVKPLMKHLQDILLADKEDESDLTNDMKHKVFRYLEEKYSNPDTSTLLDICTFLDPRFKMDYVPECDRIDLKAKITVETMLVAEKRGNTSTTTQQQQTAEDTSGDGVQGPQCKKRRLADILKKPKSSESERPDQVVEKEVDRYLQSPQTETDSSPLEWWKIHSEHYPNLEIVARKYLCVCATSVMSERVFSTSGYVVSDRRSCLKPHRVNMLVFLAKNL